MSQATLKNITIYPIKSSAGIELSNSWVEEFGLAYCSYPAKLMFTSSHLNRNGPDHYRTENAGIGD